MSLHRNDESPEMEALEPVRIIPIPEIVTHVARQQDVSGTAMIKK